MNKHKAKGFFLLATSMGGSKHSLKQRLELILHRPKQLGLALALLLAVMLTATACAFGGAPEPEPPQDTTPPAEEQQPAEPQPEEPPAEPEEKPAEQPDPEEAAAQVLAAYAEIQPYGGLEDAPVEATEAFFAALPYAGWGTICRHEGEGGDAGVEILGWLWLKEDYSDEELSAVLTLAGSRLDGAYAEGLASVLYREFQRDLPRYLTLMAATPPTSQDYSAQLLAGDLLYGPSAGFFSQYTGPELDQEQKAMWDIINGYYRKYQYSMLEYTQLPELIWPVKGDISQEYGFDSQGFHVGLDIIAEEGTDIVATAAGEVTLAEDNGSYGNTVILDHGNGLVSVYGHCQELLVAVGDQVEQGDIIALSGMSGAADQPHLHFELRLDERTCDPLFFLLLYQ